MPIVHGFPPVAAPDARVLVLGSMPGVASLVAQRYYAHPRNAFWPIVAELCGFAADAAYEQRLDHLRRSGIALWDVLQSCVRAGSLDSDIDDSFVECNDFARFLAGHTQVQAVLCNGGTAFRLFTRRVRSQLPPANGTLSVIQLPSTSPAHASMRFAAKLCRWRAALQPFLRRGER